MAILAGCVSVEPETRLQIKKKYFMQVKWETKNLNEW